MHLILCSPHPKLLRNHLLSCYKRSSLPTRASVAFTCLTCIHCDCIFRRSRVNPLQIFTSNSCITYRLASLDIQIDNNSCPLQSGQLYNLPAKLLWKDCGLYTSSTPSTEEVSNRVIRKPLLEEATASPMTLHEVHPTAAITLWNKQISQPTPEPLLITVQQPA